MAEMIVVSLREISDRFGIGIEGARAKAKRRAAKGTWRILPQNHPADPLRVELPGSEWARGGERTSSPTPNAGPQTFASTHEPQRGEAYDIRELVALLEKLTEGAATTTDRLVQAEREKGEAELRAAVAVVGQEAAERSLNEVRAELEAIRERLTGTDRRRKEAEERHAAELQKARDELAEWQARPWWKKLRA